MRTLTNQYNSEIIFHSYSGMQYFFCDLLSLAFQDAFETTTPKYLSVTIFLGAVQYFSGKDLLNAFIFFLYQLVRDLVSYPADLIFLKFTRNSKNKFIYRKTQSGVGRN